MEKHKAHTEMALAVEIDSDAYKEDGSVKDNG
jgi:hypothetical protein